MPITHESKSCALCNELFEITDEDRAFYEKVGVSEPRICSWCQLIRRLAYRNERSLSSRVIDGKPTISFLSEDKPMPVLTHDAWYGDSWDPLDYGAAYDFSKPFFVQYAELLSRAPWPALLNLNSTNSEYSNYASNNTNCYLMFGGDYNENCSYATFSMHARDSMDMYFTEKSELCYEITDCRDCYRVFFSQYASHCNDSLFLYACTNCSDCIGCVNLNNKHYCILNTQYTKAEFEQKRRDLNLGNYEKLLEFKKRFDELMLCVPHRYARIERSEDSSGNNLSQVKHCINCFDVYDGAENCKNLFLAGWNLKDSRNCSTSGYDSQLIYDSLGAFSGCSMIRFSYFNSGCMELWYSLMCKSSQNLFGCFGLTHKSFCILNKQYTPTEYNELLSAIIKHMNDVPYTAPNGYVYMFSDFFPSDLSPFCYNESSAQEYAPLTEESAVARGYRWKKRPTSKRMITKQPTDLPSSCNEVKDDILGEVIGCLHAETCQEQCTGAFKILPHELKFYQKMNIPLPRLCPNCRHYQRLKQRNPAKLWRRACSCAGVASHNGLYINTVPHTHGAPACEQTFETSYSPDCPEIVYCEQCHKAETH